MTLHLKLSPELESQLSKEAARRGVPLSEFAMRVLADVVNEPPPAIDAAPKNKQRVAGLHPGAMVMSDDFDAELPDEFWMGEE